MKSIKPDLPPKKRAKILMLHGNGQSGSFFHAKTRAIRESCCQAFATSVLESKTPFFPGGVEFVYPDAPLPIPDNSSVEDSIEDEDGASLEALTLYDIDDARSSSRIWGYGDPDGDKLFGLELCLRHLLKIMQTEGPFIGIMGFSAGACMAAILTAILERKERCDFLEEQLEAQHPPLRFTVCFSGFRLTHPKFHSLYLGQIRTPVLHVTGIYDFWVPQSQTDKLVEICVNWKMICFEGAHYVPGGSAVKNVVKFIRESLGWEDEPASADDWIDV